MDRIDELQKNEDKTPMAAIETGRFRPLPGQYWSVQNSVAISNQREKSALCAELTNVGVN